MQYRSVVRDLLPPLSNSIATQTMLRAGSSAANDWEQKMICFHVFDMCDESKTVDIDGFHAVCGENLQ